MLLIKTKIEEKTRRDENDSLRFAFFTHFSCKFAL